MFADGRIDFIRSSETFLNTYSFKFEYWKLICGNEFFLNTVIAPFAIGIFRHYDNEIELAMVMGFPFY